VNYTRLPKEVHLPHRAHQDNQVIKGRSCTTVSRESSETQLLHSDTDRYQQDVTLY